VSVDRHTKERLSEARTFLRSFKAPRDPPIKGRIKISEIVYGKRPDGEVQGSHLEDRPSCPR
jgi:hypothetical protein